MKQLATVGLLVLAVCGTTVPVRAESRPSALRAVAVRLGYTYHELGPENAVSLTRPGLTILIRPGEETYDVNDRVETTEKAPFFDRNGLYVSSALVQRLGQIARQYPGTERVILISAQPKTQAAPAAVGGAISFDVQPLPGREALVVTGKAPPLAPVFLTLTGTLSSDIPDVLVSRHQVAAAPDGSFAAVLPIASDYLRGSTLHVVATSDAGVRNAVAQVVIGAPNATVSVPIEHAEKSDR